MSEREKGKERVRGGGVSRSEMGGGAGGGVREVEISFAMESFCVAAVQTPKILHRGTVTMVIVYRAVGVDKDSLTLCMT